MSNPNPTPTAGSLGPPLIPPRLRLRSRKACVSCHSRKVKCSGIFPCSNCTVRGIACTPNVRLSRRTSKDNVGPRIPGKETVGAENNLVHSLIVEEDKIEDESEAETRRLMKETKIEYEKNDEPFYHEVHLSVTEKDVNSGSPIQIFYGPSSPFAFLQQLHQMLSYGRSSNNVTAQKSTDAVSEFGYTNVFFGTDHINPLDMPFDPCSLPLEYATEFLEAYLSIMHPKFPICEKSTLRTMFNTAFSRSNTNAHSRSRDSVLVVAMLAIGATLSDNDALAQPLYQWARSKVDICIENINLRTIQISMLLAEYAYTQGQPNAAALGLSFAAQMAKMLGIHRNLPSSSRRLQDQSPNSFTISDREQKSTFWSLYAFDRTVALFLGRPASIHEMDVDVKRPTDDYHLYLSVRLSEIAHNVSQQIYGPKRGTVLEFFERVDNIRQDLLRFQKELKPEYQSLLSTGSLKESSVVLTSDKILLAFDFFYITMIALRPCLVLDAVRRSRSQNASQTTIPAIFIKWISEICTSCCKYARHIIDICSEGLDTNPSVQRMRHARFFLEGACLVLLFDMIRDPTRSHAIAKQYQSVSKAMSCFTRLPSDKLLSMTIKAISRLIGLTSEFVSCNKGDSTSSLSQVLYDTGSSPATSQLQAVNGDNVVPHTTPESNGPDMNTNLSTHNEPADLDKYFANWDMTTATDLMDDSVFNIDHYLWTFDGDSNDFEL